MLKHADITERRIHAFVEQTLRPLLWAENAPLTVAVHQTPPGRDYRDMAINPAAARQFAYQPVEVGFSWGPSWSDAWFVLTGTVPAAWQGKTVVARFDLGAESIVWEGDNPLQGIDHNHREYILLPHAQGGETVSLNVQATGMHPSISLHGKPKDPPPAPFQVHFAHLAVYDPELWGLFYDVQTAYRVMQEQPKDGPRYGQLLYALNAVVNGWDETDSSTLPALRRALNEVYNRPASASAHQISAIGHAHIDTAWLWPLERTQYKCLHTFSTALQLMDEYPEYKFVCSQAAQYEWVKNLAPKLYERIKAKIKSGQWEVTGSMWVEADCNLASGESLVRQILYGKDFFQQEFGIETKDLWLPDVFGYAAALPQILQKSGVDRFMTQKISWNQINKFPHHTFQWQGIDGTRIFTHFPPADTYNGEMTPKELAYSVHNFREHDRATRSLYVYGYGDGGGGPTRQMLETARRLNNVEGMPTLTLEKSGDFFRKAMQEARDLPVWVGELYFELHRGTYTTQAANKKGNRKAEFGLRDAEFLSVIHPNGLADYPSALLERTWKTTLLNQFHDIIPGSSIREVYEDSDRDYADIERNLAEIKGEGFAALGAAINTQGVKRPALIVSNLSHYASEAVSVPIREGETPVAAVGPEGEIAPVQIIEGETDGKRHALWVAKNIPLHGYAVWDLNATTILADEFDSVIVTPTSLENDALLIEFDPQTGLIARIYDKDSERDVLPDTHELDAGGNRGATIPTSMGNQLWLYEDKPLFWEAWDIDVFYQEKGRLLTELAGVEIVENGPVRGAIRFTRTFGSSTITQTIRLTSGSARIDFVTEVNWQESEKLLKASFPVAINAARATYEIQYGHTERPTHVNTSWDLARFEVCAHKWADLSEGDYGVALLNDCKYGYQARGNVLSLTLLRAPNAPDPLADRGRHTFTYSLLPHGGDLRDGEVIENAYALNSPPHTQLLTANQSGRLPLLRSFFEVDNASVFLEAIKKAERENAVIVRLYEAHNTRGTVTLTTTLPAKRAFLCDLLEANIVELSLSGSEVVLPIQPFEIVTVKFTL